MTGFLKNSILVLCLILTAMFLAPSSARAAAASGAVPDISKTPAYELLGALDLLNVVPREGLAVGKRTARPDASGIIRITLDAKPATTPFGARGLGMLQVELANSQVVSLQSFDLLYNAGGRLIAVFPVFPEGILNKEPQTAEKWETLRPQYLDLSPFYMEVPRSGDTGELEKWKTFSATMKNDQDLIGNFLEENFKTVSTAYPGFLKTRSTYRLHEIDSVTGEWTSYEFNPLVFSVAPGEETILSDVEPEELFRIFSEPKPDSRRTVIPTFPTVYALVTFSPDEMAYMRGVSKKFALAPDSKVLVVGPGTGVDVWIASFLTKEPIRVIGINPLEVANTVSAAKIAGFKVNAIVGDNVADEKGGLRLPGENFDAVFWNMPAVWEDGVPAGHIPSLYDLWDGDIGGLVLARFAKALPALLKPDGRALLWNYAPYAGGKNLVAEALKSAGTKGEVFDVEVERFLKRSTPKEEWFKGRLYTVSRAR